MLSFWTASRVTRPLRALTSSVREVADGQVGHASGRRFVGRSRTAGARLQPHDRAAGGTARPHDPGRARGRVARTGAAAGARAEESAVPVADHDREFAALARAASPEQFDEVFRESTTTLLAELDNLKTIVGRFSDFAKMPAPHLEPVDVNQVAREVVKLFDAQMQAPGRPPVETQLAARRRSQRDPGRSRTDPPRLAQSGAERAGRDAARRRRLTIRTARLRRQGCIGSFGHRRRA